jgi:hypothetical protein
MLEAAAATQVGEITGGLNALRGGFQNFQSAKFIEFTTRPHNFCHDGFARHGAINELGLAIIAGNATAIVAERFDRAAHGFLWKWFPASSAH